MSDQKDEPPNGELIQLFTAYIRSEMAKCETLAEIEERVGKLQCLIDILGETLRQQAHSAMDELLFLGGTDG